MADAAASKHMQELSTIVNISPRQGLASRFRQQLGRHEKECFPEAEAGSLENQAAAAARTTANSSTANDVSMTVMAAPRLTRRRSGQRPAERTRAPPSTLMH